MAMTPQDDTFIFDDNTPYSPMAGDGTDDVTPDDPDGGSRPDTHQYHPVSVKPGHFHPVAPTIGPRRSRLVIDAPVHRVNGRQLSHPTRHRDRDMLDCEM